MGELQLKKRQFLNMPWNKYKKSFQPDNREFMRIKRFKMNFGSADEKFASNSEDEIEQENKIQSKRIKLDIVHKKPFKRQCNSSDDEENFAYKEDFNSSLNQRERKKVCVKPLQIFDDNERLSLSYFKSTETHLKDGSLNKDLSSAINFNLSNDTQLVSESDSHIRFTLKDENEGNTDMYCTSNEKEFISCNFRNNPEDNIIEANSDSESLESEPTERRKRRSLNDAQISTNKILDTNLELNSFISEINRQAKPEKLILKKGGYLEKCRAALRRSNSNVAFWQHEGKIGVRDKGYDAIIKNKSISFGRILLTLLVQGEELIFILHSSKELKNLSIGSKIEVCLETDSYQVESRKVFLYANKFLKNLF